MALKKKKTAIKANSSKTDSVQNNISSETIQQPPTVVATPPIQPAQIISTPKKSNKTVLILVVLLLTCCICSTIAGVAYYFYKVKPSTTSSAQPPSIDILMPTGSNWYSSNLEKVNISGVISNSSNAKKVTWQVDGGNTTTLSVDKDWKTSEITLKEGDNKFIFTVTDKSGKTAEDKITITYNPSVLFTENPKITPDYIFKGDPEIPYTVQAKIFKKSTQSISTVLLYESDENGELVNKIGEMKDIGVVDDGDDIPGDSNYGFKGTFQSTTSDPKYFRVVTQISGNDKAGMSSVLKVSIVDHMSQQTIQQINDLNTQVNNLVTQLQTQGKPNSQVATQVSTFVSQQPNINSSGVSQNGQGVWWVYNNTCIPGGLLITEPGNKGGTTVLNTKLLSYLGDPKPVKAGSNELKVDSSKAIYLGPYLNYFGQSDDYYGAWEEIKNSQCPQCETVEKVDGDVKVTDFKGLDQYGLIVISSHGDNWYGGLSGDNICSQGLSQSQVIIYTSEKLTAENYQTYEADLMSRKLAVGADNNLIVLPAYISSNNTNFPNSLVYVSSCRSYYNNTMMSAFVGQGAKAYYGYDDYVSADYALKAGKDLFSNFLADSKSSQDAYSSAISSAGSSDGQGADFLFGGEKSLTMGGKQFKNVSFETSDLDGWDRSGDARVISSLGSINPSDGDFMSIISTGLGSVSDSTTSVEQSVCFNGNNTKLTFDYNLISEEPMEYLNSQYDDKLQVYLIINGASTEVLSAGVNNSTWLPISGIDFDGGDSTVYFTDWQTKEIPLTGATPGSKVHLKFVVSDTGDSAYDTAALIDNIRIE